MRTFFVFLFLAIYFIVTLPFYLILLLLRQKNRHLSSVIAQKFVKYGFSGFEIHFIKQTYFDSEIDIYKKIAELENSSEHFVFLGSYAEMTV